MDKLTGKIALITGGTSGIGKAVALLFAKHGATVVIVGRNETRGQETVEQISASGAEGFFLSADVSDRQSVNMMKQSFLNRFDRLDILVNNAGILITNPLESIGDDWEVSFKVNTESVMRVTQAFMERIVACKGSIINIASEVGLQSMCAGRSNYAYAASKAAVIKFSSQLSLNYAPVGVRVNCLCPGIIDTPIYTNRDFTRFQGTIPLGYVGQPEDVANAALFLASDNASYITGAVLTVDGGASLM